MEIDSLQLTAMFTVAIGLVEIIKLLINKFAIRNGNGKIKDNTQDVDLAVLKTQMQTVLTNHIPHIDQALKEIKEEFKINETEHRATQMMISKIITKLDI